MAEQNAPHLPPRPTPDPEQEFRDKCEAYRQRLAKSRDEVLDQYSKALMTLSGGAIAISITFLKDVFKMDMVAHGWMLAGAWILWTATLTITLFGMFVSQRSHWSTHDEYCEYLDKGDFAHEFQSSAISEGNKDLKGMAFVAFALFVGGLILMAAFVTTNFTYGRAPAKDAPAATNSANTGASPQKTH